MIKVNTNWAKSAKVSNQDYSWAHVALHTLSMGYDITMTLYNNNLLERIEMTPGYATDKMVQTIKDERLKHTISGDPNKDGNMVDVVVVELKRLGIKAEQNSIVEFQLDTRCQRLAEYYNKRIQRMWFYGVVDFDERYETHLINNGFDPLYSNGNV